MLAKERLIVALDFAEEQAVKELVEKLGDEVVYYKVGMELYYSVGPSILDYLAHKGKKIFLDLKLMDIPNTVAQAMANLAMRPGIDIVNVHASGGPTMIKLWPPAHATSSARFTYSWPFTSMKSD